MTFQPHIYKSSNIDIYGNSKISCEEVFMDESEKNFTQWKLAVDEQCVKSFGLSSDDLPDALWRDYFEDGMTAYNAIDCAVYDAWYDVPGMEELWNV